MPQRQNKTTDPLVWFSATRQWADAEARTRGELDALRNDSEALPLEVARAARRVVEVLLELERLNEATELFHEVRRRYRPFLGEPGPLAEFNLTFAKHALMTARSHEAETAIGIALNATDNEPQLRLLLAQALRFKAHLLILRGDFHVGAEQLEAARQKVSSDDEESRLLRLQYLFSLAEVHVMLGDHILARTCTQNALDLVHSELPADLGLLKCSRGRACQIYTANGDHTLAATLSL